MKTSRPIIFFDGICNLCNGFIDLILKNDRKHIFYVASLQGTTAQERLNPSDLETVDSIILLNGSQTYYKSAAIFRIALQLKGIYLLIVPFWILPRFFTDWIYDFVAINRYRIFGKSNSCRIPTESEQKHFLD